MGGYSFCSDAMLWCPVMKYTDVRMSIATPFNEELANLLDSELVT